MAAKRSYAAYAWIKEREAQFDFVHFPEWQGAGFFTTQAKRTGLCCANMTLVVQPHSPSIWAMEGNAAVTSDKLVLDVDFLEQRSVEQADVVVSPSRYMLTFLASHGWQLPARSFYNPNPVLHQETEDTGLVPRRVQRPCVSPPELELVFFGRLEQARRTGRSIGVAGS